MVGVVPCNAAIAQFGLHAEAQLRASVKVGWLGRYKLATVLRGSVLTL